MKVLLKQDMDRLGRMGEIVDVARGYARNYLIPRGLAVGVTRGTVKDIEEQQKVLEVKAARLRESLEAVAEKLSGRKVVIKARCSASGKLFGSVTSRQLAQELETLTGEEVDRHKILMDEKVRTVGTYKAVIKLHPDVSVEVEYEVEGEGFVAEEPEEEAADGAAPEEGAAAAAGPEPGQGQEGEEPAEEAVPAAEEEQQPAQE